MRLLLALLLFAGNHATVRVSWNPDPSATTFNIFRASSPVACSGSPYATGITSTSWTDTSVKAGDTYYYSIQAVNKYGQACGLQYAQCGIHPPLPHNCTINQSTSGQNKGSK